MKKILTRKASDHEYYHPDFHLALDHGLLYLLDRFGERAVREYLSQFASIYFASLKQGLMTEGLSAVRRHYEKIYRIERASYNIRISKDEGYVTVHGSPAVRHMKAKGHDVSPVFHETVATVNKEICRHTDFDCELLHYNPGNGAYQLHFYRKKE